MQYIIVYSKRDRIKECFYSDYFVEEDYEVAQRRYQELLNKSEIYSVSICVALESTDYDTCKLADQVKRDKQIQDLSDALLEKRSDISEILAELLKTGELNLDWIEHRFAKGKIPIKDAYIDDDGKLEVMYDTLTTHLEYPTKHGPWDVVGNEEYED